MTPDSVTAAAWQFLTDRPVSAAVLAAVALAGLALCVRVVRHLFRATGRTVAAGTRAVRRATAGADPADLLTPVAASIATAVAAQGMWRFFGDVLLFPPALRVGMFAFVEIAVITSAVRARRNMREHHSGGIDGAAVWVLTGLSAMFSAMDARSFPEAVFRLAAPLVAAWLWERGMAVERRRLTGRSGIHWRLTPERVLVRLGLAEASGRTAGQVDNERRLTRLALAAKTARTHTTATGRIGGWRQRRALARLDTAMHQAVTHTALAVDLSQQRHLLAQLAALTNASSLLSLTHPAPWQSVLTPPGTGIAEQTPPGEATPSALPAPAVVLAPGYRVHPDARVEPVVTIDGLDVTPKPTPAPRPSTRRASGRSAGTSTATKVARLRRQHPDWTLGRIAEKAGCDVRTVRRHLNAPGTTPTTTEAAGDVAA